MGLGPHYERRAAELARELAILEAKSDTLSSRRGLVMIAILGSGITLLVASLPVWAWAVPGVLLAVFVALVVKHAFIASDKTMLEERRSYVIAGQRRLAGEPEPDDPHRPKLPDPDGKRFEKPDHPNASDLDLFGPKSLFVSLSRAETAVGEETLAKWLLEPAPKDVALARQAAARELLETPELLEDLSVLAKRAESRGRAEEPLALWGEAPAEMPVGASQSTTLKNRALLILAGRLLVPITLATFFFRPLLATVHPRLGLVWILPFVLQLAVLGSLLGPINRMVTFVSSRESPFGRFRAVFARIEGLTLKSPRLAAIVDTVRGPQGSTTASEEIAKLEKIIGFADVRHNTIIHIVLNLGFLWDIWVALALERWRARSGKRTRAWLSALGELEALASIATYAGEHPDFVWPEIDDAPTHLEADGLSHPLLSPATRVANVAELPQPGRAYLVTGSNMSGKSTYLRSLGLLSVMANAGLPVCARSARLSTMTAWTSMRISDALDQGWSHFYAELLRLKAIVAAAHKGENVLFLLDEILHGTNSSERTIGARGVVLDLVHRGAIGAVSTHDFALIAIAEESEGAVRTVHFSDHIEADKMVFDYKLKEGVVQSTNAIRLMKAVGIDVDYGVS